MAYEGKSPDSDWIQMNPRTTEPSFPATATPAYKEGTLFVSNDDSGTGTFSPPGLYVFIRDSTGASYSWQILTPNNNATQIDNGNLGAEFGGVPCGTIIPFAKDVSSTGLPTGYLLCDGSSVSQTSFATLFTAMGGSTGGGVAFGDGTTGTGSAVSGNFNLPDFRGLFMRGTAHTSTADPDSGTRTAYITGGQTVDNVGSYQDFATEAHTHNTTTDGVRFIGSSQNIPNAPGPQVNNSTVSWLSSTNSGSTSTETRPKNIYVDYIIRYL